MFDFENKDYGNMISGQPVSAITGQPMPTVQQRFNVVNMIGDYLRGNLMGRAPEGKWFSGDRVSGRQEPRLYAEPKYNWELGQSGAWKGRLGIFKKFMSLNPSASIDDIVKGTGFTRYEAETLSDLLSQNAKNLKKTE